MNNPKCPVWGTPAALQQLGDHDAVRVRSPRAGGDYRITGPAVETINAGALDEQARARLTTALIDRRRDGDDAPLVDSNLLEESRMASALSHEARATRLLRHIDDRVSAAPRRSLSLETDDPGTLAHSESWTGGQLQELTDQLVKARLLYIDVLTRDSKHYGVTLRGRMRLHAARADVGP